MKSDRRSLHARTLFIGVTASVVVHLALFAVLRFNGEPLESPVQPEVVFDTPEPLAFVPEEEIAEVVAEADPVPSTAPSMDVVDASLEGVAATSAAEVAAAQPTTSEAPLNGDPVLPAAEVADVPAVTETVLAVADPALAVITEAAETEKPSDELDESVPVWRPGTVGKAKRQWANNGSGASSRGNGDGVGIRIGRGGGHCPMPGRGRGRPALPPPSWFD